MAAALPIAKLASLLVKTLAKPTSKWVKHEFSRHRATRSLLVSLGQMTHTLSSRMKIWSEGYKVRSIAPIDKNDALGKGADLVGESFIFIVAGGLVVWEYEKGKEKERVKEKKKFAKVKAASDELQRKLVALDSRLMALEEVVVSNSKSLFNLAGKKYVEPKEKSVLIAGDGQIGKDADNNGIHSNQKDKGEDENLVSQAVDIVEAFFEELDEMDD